ncbi:MAG: protease pro-enzyme activation domain-containing protein [Acidobacteriota bacterium]|nr:protease pro-enzyme activation domain-containing protein [Acidobacteriota bacterium]
MSRRISIPGSEPEPRAQERWLADVDPSTKITASILLRRSSSNAEELLSGHYHPASREAAERTIAANPKDLAAVRCFAEEHGMTIVDDDAALRRVRVEATAKQMEDAFGVQIGTAEDASGRRFLTYKGAITIPDELSGIVVAVLGLDQRPVARHADPSQ